MSSVALGKGESLTRKATVDKEAYNKTVTYESSDPTIVSVTKDGKIKGLKIGTATIKAVASNGISKSYIVTVKKVPRKVSLTANTKIILVNGRVYLRTIFAEDEASYKLTYSTSNKKIATVSKDGIVTARKKGTVTIKVKTFNGKTAKIKIKVVK